MVTHKPSCQVSRPKPPARSFITFGKKQIKQLTDTICKGCSPDELEHFIQQCKRTGLNPFTEHVNLERRWDALLGREHLAIQTTIDTFRLIAERIELYAGQVGPFWCGEDGVWHDIWTAHQFPIAAKVGVLRHDFHAPCYGVAHFLSYVQRDANGQIAPRWITMPETLLAQCAEALALRRAHASVLAGLYTFDEAMPI